MKSKQLLSSSLSELIEKFSREDVVEEMEKEYQSAPAKLLSLSLLDDVSFLKEAVIPEETIDYFALQIKEKGLFNPLIVRPKEDRYEVILGRKRYYGANKAGLVSVPVVVANLEDEEVLLMLLADTRDQREFNVVEMALLCQELQTRFHYTQQTLADLSFQSRSQITNTLRILKLPAYLRKEICLEKITYGHAKAIASLDKDQINDIVRRIHEDNLSVRETEALAKSYRDYGKSGALERSLGLCVGAEVILKKKSVTFVFPSENEKESFINSLLAGRPEIGVCKLELPYTFSLGPYGQSKIVSGVYEGQILGKAISRSEEGEYASSFPIFPFRISQFEGDGNVYVDPDDSYAKKQYVGHFGGNKVWYILNAEEGALLRLGPNRQMDKDEFKNACKENTVKEKLNEFKPDVGAFLEVPPGTVYSVDPGIKILEVRENSDVCYPLVGKKPRLLDGMKVVNLSTFYKGLYLGEMVSTSPNFTIYKYDQTMNGLTLNKDSLGAIVILEGEGDVEGEIFSPGDVFFVPAKQTVRINSKSCRYIFVQAERKIQLSLFA